MTGSKGLVLAVLALVGFWAGGCARGPVSRLPSTEVLWPSMDLTLSWNQEAYHAPEPVIVPGGALEKGLKQWDLHRSAFWPVSLEHGRRAVVVATRDGDGKICMDRVYVYRVDGSLEVEQWNDEGRPNVPGYWIVYEPDGKTRRAEVTVNHDKGATEHHITEVVLYEGGMRSLRYAGSAGGVVQTEDRFNADGSTTLVHARPGLMKADAR